ncbi:MAG: carbohydrate ABC transporter permease [Solirubrobacterales bacterium]
MGQRIALPRTRALTASGARRRRRALWPYGFVAPAIAVLALVFVYPIVQVVRYSFYAGSPGEAMTYVGLANYRNVVADPVFRHSVLNNVKLLATVPVMTALALAVALLLNGGIKGWRQFRAIVFLPYILPAAAVGLTFSYLLQRNGVINAFLHDVGLASLAPDWLGSTRWVVPSIGGVIIWQQLGFGVVVFTAALLALPGEVSEAARLDGATSWQLQRLILIPQIRGIVEFFVVLEAITVLSQVFNYVYVLTGGGPGNASSVMEFYIWKNGFSLGSVGVASTVAVMLLGVAGVLIFVYMRVRARAASA